MGKLLFGSIIEEYSIKAKTDTNYVVCSVTNTNGFQKSSDTFDKKVFSEDLSAYKKVYRGSFAYNPSRINVGSIGCQNIDECVLVSPLYNIFEVNTDVTTPEFVSYFIRSNYVRNYIKENTQGTVRANFKMSEMSKLHFPNITLDEQKRIIEEFKILEKVIKENEHQLFLYDELVKSRFVEMFGDPNSNPFKWKEITLANVILKANNGMARRGNDINGNIVIRLVELQDGFINYEKPNRISLKEEEKIRYLLAEKDFLFARVNGNPENVGRCAVFHDIDEPVYFNDHIIRVHFDESLVNGNFASFLLNSDYGKQKLRSQIKTSAGQYTISQDGIGAIALYLPPLGLQKQFSEFVEQIDKLKFIVEEQLKLMNELLNKKMDEYFN